MSEVSFTASENSNMASVRNALHQLHAKVAMLEKDRDAHHTAAARARTEHEEYKLRAEAEINRERMLAAQRERQLLEDVAAAEAEINHLKTKLRDSTTEPLPRANLKTDYDVEFEKRSGEAVEQERARIREVEHEMEKLNAERQVLESANVQLDNTIQHLLRSNEELLHMLRVVPRKGGQEGNPASAVGANIRAQSPSSRQQMPPLGGGGGGGGGSLSHPPLRFQSPRPVNSGGGHSVPRSTSVERTTVSYRAHLGGRPGTATGGPRKTKKDELWDRLAQPRSCSRQRAGTPPRFSGAGHMGTSKNTARRFLTQELRAHASAAVPQ